MKFDNTEVWGLNVDRTTIHNIVKGKTWREVF